MYKLSLIQEPGISREQLREQIQAQVQQATTEARQAIRDAQGAGGNRVMVHTETGTPTAPGVPMVAARGMDRDMPPRVKDVSIAFFIMLAAIIIALPIMRAIGKRIERGAPAPMAVPPKMQHQMQHLMQSVDAIAIEVERISEGQRFATKLLSERDSGA